MEHMKNKIEIIAEVAQGFEGDKKLASLLTQGAIASNADAVKFQLVYADELATPDYQHYQLFKNLEMQQNIWVEICKQIHNADKKVYFDVFGLHSLEVARKLDADGVKLSTTEFYNNALFDKAIAQFNNIYLSVGGIPIEDIDKKLSVLNSEQMDTVCLMYGFQSEPTPVEQNNLNKLRLLKQRYPSFKIGFMDHSDGGLDDAFHLSLVALGVGVDSIEKHITLDRELKIEDYISGITPDNFVAFVNLINRFEPALGIDTLDLTDLEKEYRSKATKSVVAMCNLNAGDIITQDMVALKRSSQPLTHDSILELKDVIGKKLNTNILMNAPITKSNI